MKNNKMAKLKQKREKHLQALPPLEECVRGTVYKRRIKCGKDYCHCATGAKHIIWHFSAAHPKGKTEQICLHRKQVSTVQRWVNNYKKAKKILESVSVVNRDIIREQRAQLKEEAKKQ